jgi:hypothetical protein
MTDSLVTMVRNIPRILILVLAASILTAEVASSAVCVNRFVVRKERFQEAQVLSKAINEKKSPPLEWVDDSGKTIARQFGDLKVVRPMPVGCDGKTSGVVMIATFVTQNSPAKKMNVKIDPQTLVAFEQQAE